MKKILYLLSIALIATSCARGYYAPRNTNQYGVQTQVVLNKANFRIVRHLEVVIDVNNTDLKRADVEKSAYAELLRRANLTGSQALINVVVEEVRRESTNIFRILFGLPKVVQHVAARATVIEFLDDNGNPIQSTDVQGTVPRIQDKLQTVSASNNDAQQGNAQQVQDHTSAKQNQTSSAVDESESVYALFPNIDKEDVVEPQLMANDCYIAYLLKSNQYNQSADRDLLKSLCDVAHIQTLVKKYDVALLNEYSKNHAKQLTYKYKNL